MKDPLLCRPALTRLESQLETRKCFYCRELAFAASLTSVMDKFVSIGVALFAFVLLVSVIVGAIYSLIAKIVRAGGRSRTGRENPRRQRRRKRFVHKKVDMPV